MDNQSSSVTPALPQSTSADDLLDMYDEIPETPAAEPDVVETSEPKPPSVATTETLPLDETQNGKEADKEGPTSTTSDGEKEVGKEGLLTDKKVVTAKFGDEELSIPEEAVFTATINGKEVPAKIADAIKAYSEQETFNRKLDQRLSYADRREKDVASKMSAYQAELASVKTRAGEISKLFAQGDVLPAVKQLARMAAGANGLDEVAYEKQALDALEQAQSVYTKMTPQQREVYFANRKAELASKELERQKGEMSAAQAKQQLDAEISAIEKQLGFNRDQFWDYYEVLMKESVGPGKQFADPKQITPKDVADFHQKVQLSGKIDQALTRIDKTLLNNESFLEALDREVEGRYDLTADDIETIVRIALDTPTKSVENLNRKVDQANSKGLRTQLKQASSTKKEEKTLDDELYDEWFAKRPTTTRK